MGSTVSLRRCARLLRLNRKTVARTFKLVSRLCHEQLYFETAFNPATNFTLDDLESFEHTKLKPLSVITAVTEERRVLAFRVAEMPAKGRLAEKSMRKYGKRKDGRSQARKDLFQELQGSVQPGCPIKSDENPHYKADVKKFFPQSPYVTFLSKRSADTGQGELKKVKYDPLFSLNHTFAMFRANISRLIRKTWCTTKQKERLADHLAIYAVYHNAHLKTK